MRRVVRVGPRHADEPRAPCTGCRNVPSIRATNIGFSGFSLSVFGGAWVAEVDRLSIRHRSRSIGPARVGPWPRSDGLIARDPFSDGPLSSLHRLRRRRTGYSKSTVRYVRENCRQFVPRPWNVPSPEERSSELRLSHLASFRQILNCHRNCNIDRRA